MIGGTGATGKHLVNELVNSSKFSSITSLVRRKSPLVNSEKLDQVEVNMEEMDKYTEYFKDKDVAFCLLGTTRKDAGSDEAFRKVDLDYVTHFGRLSREANIPSMHLLTSNMADKNSMFLYIRTKGEAEDNYKNMNFKLLNIWKPGLLDRGNEARLVEKIALWLKRGMPVGRLAAAMRIVAEQNDESKLAVQLFSDADITRIVDSSK